jgi:hypothetical protein
MLACDLATIDESRSMVEIAGSRAEHLVGLAATLAAGTVTRSTSRASATQTTRTACCTSRGQVLAGPDAIITSPAFAE